VYGQMGAYSEDYRTPHEAELLVDVDGEVFGNYLSSLWETPSLFPPNAVEMHRDRIAAELEKPHDSRIRGKYEWVAQYHNWFCTLPANKGTGWDKLQIAPGESRRVTLTADRRLLARFDEKAHAWRIPAGRYEVALGTSAADLGARAEVTLQAASFKP